LYISLSESAVNTPEQIQLRSWTYRHAAGLIAAGVASLLLRTPIPATVVGVLSLLLLVFHHRGRWTPSGIFGPANMVTTIRLAMVAGLCAMGFLGRLGPASALLVLTIFALDGLDGSLAKRSGHSSLFGAAFDMECDALLVLVGTMLLYLHGRLGVYVLIPGFLRYVYVLGVACLPGGGAEPPASRFGRYAFSVFAVSMMVSLWPIEPVYAPLAVLATLLIVWSFTRGLSWSLRHSSPVVSDVEPAAATHPGD
jgi:phosphatidylglycerophosphate synthase